MIKKLFLILIFWTMSCGVDVSTTYTEQAISNPQDGITQPWICSPFTYDPFVTGWPAHGWCKWQPDASTGLTPTAVSFCSGIPDAGQIDIWSGRIFTGRCARITIPSTWDFTHVAVNGWNSVSSQRGILPMNIFSFELGSQPADINHPHAATYFIFSQGPSLENSVSFYCTGHTGDQIEHRKYCGISNLGIYSFAGWTDNSHIASFQVIRP